MGDRRRQTTRPDESERTEGQHPRRHAFSPPGHEDLQAAPEATFGQERRDRVGLDRAPVPGHRGGPRVLRHG